MGTVEQREANLKYVGQALRPTAEIAAFLVEDQPSTLNKSGRDKFLKQAEEARAKKAGTSTVKP